jgi:DnaJ-class molecular chaperone
VIERCTACRGSGIVAGAGEYVIERCRECDGYGFAIRPRLDVPPEARPLSVGALAHPGRT